METNPFGCGYCGVKPSEGKDVEISKYFSDLGKKGGQAGKGKKKRRGNSEYYSNLRKKKEK